MNRSVLLSRVVAAAISVGVVAVGLPAFAADDAQASWFANQKEVLRQKLESAPPVTFKFIGDRVMPVFVKKAPKYVVIFEIIDSAVAGGSNARAMR